MNMKVKRLIVLIIGLVSVGVSAQAEQSAEEDNEVVIDETTTIIPEEVIASQETTDNAVLELNNTIPSLIGNIGKSFTQNG